MTPKDVGNEDLPNLRIFSNWDFLVGFSLESIKTSKSFIIEELRCSSFLELATGLRVERLSARLTWRNPESPLLVCLRPRFVAVRVSRFVPDFWICVRIMGISRCRYRSQNFFRRCCKSEKYRDALSLADATCFLESLCSMDSFFRRSGAWFKTDFENVLIRKKILIKVKLLF